MEHTPAPPRAPCGAVSARIVLIQTSDRADPIAANAPIVGDERRLGSKPIKFVRPMTE
jgi:hypothetical protein